MLSATDPIDQLLASSDEVAENAEYDAVDTATPAASRAAGMTARVATRAMVRFGRILTPKTRFMTRKTS
ncbi:hypothetical protein QP157_20675 [Sphingomonas sp. LR61]|uniref:hypothetical protein n=1 Tax=Sphingomonas sp. LR61 TaxID=3050234 RepID=UPI002FE27F9B